LVFSAFFILPSQYIDKFFLERLNNVNEFAFYNIADNISGYFTVFSTAVLQAVEPDIFKFTGLRNKSAILKTFLLFFITLLTAFILFALISEYAVGFLTADRYLGATRYMIPMLMVKLLLPILYFLGFILISLHLTKVSLLNQIISACFALPTYYLLIQKYSFLGAVYAKIIVLLIWLVIVLSEIYLRNSYIMKKLSVKH
jgi:O-antigen/teichoic acid export membrane protein